MTSDLRKQEEAGPAGDADVARVTRRRALLAGAGALASVAVGASAVAAGEHEAHGSGHKYTEAKAAKQHPALVAAANDCVAKGQVCLSHCFETFVQGDTTMATCALSVEQMLHVCTALAYLAAFDSKSLRKLADACVDVCADCEKECRVHEEHQTECKACADACAAVIREAKKLLA